MKSNNTSLSSIEESDSSETDSDPIGDVFIDIRSSLLSFVARFFKNQHAAVEDVVQETYIRALEAQKRTGIVNPRAYLYQTSRNLALKELGRSAYRLNDSLEKSSLEQALTSGAGLDEEYAARQTFELFCRAVRQLPVKCRRVYVLRKVYGFSQKEIASRMNISEKTVEAHLAKAAVRCLDFMDANESSLVKSQVKSRKKH
jgi:RNA polymerase sigma-70 factor (ECF subfamily)